MPSYFTMSSRQLIKLYKIVDSSQNQYGFLREIFEMRQEDIIKHINGQHRIQLNSLSVSVLLQQFTQGRVQGYYNFDYRNHPPMRRDQNYDYLAKLLIIGDSGVGKTNILLRFCENNFMTSHLTTIGIDFKIKTIEIDGKKIRLQIWDTAGQERFKTITQTYYKGAMGIIMVYSINDRASFNALENWMRQIKTHASENVVKVLIGNKSDMADRQVSFEEGKKMADSFGINFFEVSAKNNTNITETFTYMAKEIKQKVLTGDESAYTKQFPKGSKISQQKTKEKAKSGCC